MKNRSLGLMALALAAAATSAHAAVDTKETKKGDPRPTLAAQFEKLDGNRNGYIERTEAEGSKRLSKSFDQLDTDKDGRISAQEWQQQPERGDGRKDKKQHGGKDRKQNDGKDKPGPKGGGNAKKSGEARQPKAGERPAS